MDPRWTPCARDSKRQAKIILHPTASMREVRVGFDTGSDDSIDLSPFVTQASHSMFDANITLAFNREFFGVHQPRPNQILEIQVWQKGKYQTIWIGILDSISSFTMSRGDRSMQLSAKSRDSQDIWRLSKRVTPLYPQMTDLVLIINRIARTVGLNGEEIVLPPTSFTTTHSNTQLADMSAWDMINALCVPIGWTPFIDGLGRLRKADRGLQNRVADIVLEDWQVVKIGAQRMRPPANRVRVQWLNPTLKRAQQQGRLVGRATMTVGWFLPLLWHKVYFSDDQTQRVEKTELRIVRSANLFTKKLNYPFVEHYHQQAENEGRITIINKGFDAMVAATALWVAATAVPSAFYTGLQAIPMTVFMVNMIMMGTGEYEIWGIPFDWVHARNTTEAFDASAPIWVDTGVDIETDFILNEPHAQAVAVRELIYQARAANKWNVTLVDIPGLEFGDIIEFSDGSQIFVEDFNRSLARGSEATLEVRGFLMGGDGIQTSISAPLAGDTTGSTSGEVGSPGDGDPDPAPDPDLPGEAPNGSGTVSQVFSNDTQWPDPSGWHLKQGPTYDQTDIHGRGAFVEAVVVALHAVDPRWGHVRADSPSPRYNGHDVDTIMWKNPDGVTAEVYDIVSFVGVWSWSFVNRNRANLAYWKFPA